MRRAFSNIATFVATAVGQPITFVLASAVVLGWLVGGPLFHFSDTWQLVVNTISSVVTLLMVFLIQNSQNRDAAAMQAKLDELLRAVDKAREQFIGIEHLTDEQIGLIRTALERHASEQSGQQQDAEDAVERLLEGI